jgi:hypothetical protein
MEAVGLQDGAGYKPWNTIIKNKKNRKFLKHKEQMKKKK